MERRERRALTKGKSPFVYALGKIGSKERKRFRLRAYGDPIDPIGNGTRAVSLNALPIALRLEKGYERIGEKESGLATRPKQLLGGKRRHGAKNLLGRKHLSGGEIGIAIGAIQVAPGKADEHHRHATLPAFALERIEYLVNGERFHSLRMRKRLQRIGGTALGGFLHRTADERNPRAGKAFGRNAANQIARNGLGSGVERHHNDAFGIHRLQLCEPRILFPQHHTMIPMRFQPGAKTRFNLAKIDDAPKVIHLLCVANEVNTVVVPMQMTALARVTHHAVTHTYIVVACNYHRSHSVRFV